MAELVSNELVVDACGNQPRGCRMAEVVERQGLVELRFIPGRLETAPGDVAMSEWTAGLGREDRVLGLPVLGDDPTLRGDFCEREAGG